MSLREDMYKYQQLTGEDANSKSIERIGAFLDGYELCQSQIQDAIAEIETDLSWFCFDDWGNMKSEWKGIKDIIQEHTKVGDTDATDDGLGDALDIIRKHTGVET